MISIKSFGQRFCLALLLIAAFVSAANAKFLTPDWFDPTQPGVGTNRYAYALNNPILYKDPGGNDSFGSGNPYSGYDIDRDGYSQHVGGWDHDISRNVSYRDHGNDPLGRGGGRYDNIGYDPATSVQDRNAGLQSITGRFGREKGSDYYEAQRQILADTPFGRGANAVAGPVLRGTYYAGVAASTVSGVGEAAVAVRAAHLAWTSRGAVVGYRAVSAAEARDIALNGFRPGRGSMDGKWFTTTKKGAEGFLKDPRFGADTVVRTRIPRSVFDRSHRVPNIDNQGPGVYVYPEDLPFLR